MQFLVLLAQAVEDYRAFGLAIFRLVACLQAVFALASQSLPIGQKGLGRQRQGQFQSAGQFVVLLGAALPALLLGASGVDLGLDRGQAVAAVLGDGAVQLVAPRLALLATLGEGAALLAEAGAVLLQIGQALAEQFALELGEPGRQRLAAGGEVLGLGGDRGMTLAVFAQRAQLGDLVLGLEHRLVGAVEVVEVVDQRADAFLHRQLFEHMLADEVGEVAHRFHRYGLAEQLQGLLVVDPEAAAEGRTIGAEAIFENHVGQLAQALFQGRQIAAEIGEMLGDRQCAIGHQIKALWLAAVFTQPEHLGQGHVLVEALVIEVAEDHRVAVVVAQRHRLGAEAGVAAFGLVVTEHVGAQAAFLGLGPGGLVVGDLLCRHQQGGDGIHQSRFAGADVAGQQGIVAAGREAPDALVEGAPVVDLEGMQAKAGALVAAGEVQQLQGLRGGHGFTSSAPCWE